MISVTAGLSPFTYFIEDPNKVNYWLIDHYLNVVCSRCDQLKNMLVRSCATELAVIQVTYFYGEYPI